MEKGEFLKILVITHSLGHEYGGPAESFAKFLVNHKYKLTCLSLPLNSTSEQICRIKEYEDGYLLRERKSIAKRNHWYSFTADARYLFNKNNFDLVVCFNAWSLFLFKMLHPFSKSQLVVMWCVDFLPKKYSHKKLEILYRYVEEQSLHKCDVYIDNNQYAMNARLSQIKRSLLDSKRRLLVPITHDLNLIKLTKKAVTEQISLGYIGRLDKRNGADKLVPILTILNQLGLGATLDIVGKGELEVEILQQISLSGCESKIKFHGHLDSQEEVALALENVKLGLAPYRPDTFSIYADPGKLVTLTSLGIPCLVSDAPLIAKDYEEAGAVRRISHDAKPGEWATMVISLFDQTEETLSKMRSSAVQFSHSRSSEKVFTELMELFEQDLLVKKERK